MIRRLFMCAAMLAVVAAAGCDGSSSANPKIQGDPPANPVKPLPLGGPPGGAAVPPQPAHPTIKPAG